jgi:subtilisin-like proprotein convertase family protein
MQRRSLFWFVISALALAGAIYFWHLGDKWEAERHAAPRTPAAAEKARTAISPAPATRLPLQAPPKTVAAKSNQKATAAKNKFPFRLTNSTKSLKQLLGNDKAILLDNAFIDTASSTRPVIPDSLRAAPNSGSYIIQASGPLDVRFRALLAEAGATIVSYIPNNAYLVRVSDSGAQALAGSPLTQSVLTYEPYYKLESSLMPVALGQEQMPPNTALNVTVYADALASTLKELPAMGAIVAGQDGSPFGPVLHVFPAQNTLPQIASLPGVQLVSAAHPRVSANDLTRQTLGVSADTTGGEPYLGLTGNKVLVNINDSGVDDTHPDLKGRITGDITNSVTDVIGHGTHVAGTILGSGSKSGTVSPAAQGSVLGANFAGMARAAKGYAVSIFTVQNPVAPATAAINSVLGLEGDGLETLGLTSDTYLQEQPALTNALISNNSWNYVNSPLYDISAASYDAAVRDALPGVSGPQPVLFVFSAGDDGGGNQDGTGGFPGSILSPATAKNVITVGAIEQFRNITNTYFTTNSFITNVVTTDTNGNSSTNTFMTNSITTNYPFLLDSDSTEQVADFSARGNVGIGTEGQNGRFKPDLVAPGTFVISDRSTVWDTNSYYKPVNINHFFNFVTTTNGLTNFFALAVPGDATNIIVTGTNNAVSPNPMPPLLVYAALNTPPTAADLIATNTFSLPANLPLNAGDVLFFAFVPVETNTGTNLPVNMDVLTEIDTTNDNSGYFEALGNLNNEVGPNYRYESGTSMAAASVSGMLACMQEFFEQRLNVTNSPALMKALLINGARPVSPQYDFNVNNTTSPQGWGLPNLPNTIPPTLTNYNAQGGAAGNAGSLPLVFYDQNPTNALATGQSDTRTLVITPDAGQQPLRVTLVWTDPPGSPAAGVKLVNNLVLVVSNLDTGDAFYGNDIPAGTDFNQATDTNGLPNIDLVNNVQNVFLAPPLGTNYSITVMAQRVNVNAVTVNTNNVVQDYALVISSGDAGSLPTPFVSLTESNVVTSSNLPVLVSLTNGVPAFNQRVGANPQSAPGTNGVASQWNFYILTNTTTFTGMAIAIDGSLELAVPRTGAFAGVTEDEISGTRWDGSGTNVVASINGVSFTGADLDLYVSTNSAMTNLDSVAVAQAFKSAQQGGNELILDTNSHPGEVYYIGVKSEDQQGGQFTVVGAGFDPNAPSTDNNGNIELTLLTPLPVPIPGGTPSNPGRAQVFAFSISQAKIRKVVLTNTVQAQNFGDYIGLLSGPDNHVSVINNHTFFTNLNDSAETLVYDDSGEGSISVARKTDFPGTLQNFVADKAGGGLWTFTMVNDSSSFDVGAISNIFSITIYPQPPTNKFFEEFIAANGWFYDWVDVPPNATNLTITVGVPNVSAPLQLYVRRGTFPTQSNYDQFLSLPPNQTNSLTITVFDSPPLNPGRYFYGIFNPNPGGVTVEIETSVGVAVPTLPDKWLVSSDTPLPLPDDAVTNSTIFVGNNEAVAGVQVGVRLDHPRESDLVMTLISPNGTRVLLSENRGGVDTNGYGSGVNITNVFPTTANGTQEAETNTLTISTNSTGLVTGTLVIGYDMFNIPDDMRVYYQNVLIFDSGLVSGTGTFTVSFGPGTDTNIVVVMNAPGTNPATNGDLWNYTVTAIQQKTAYAIFTDDTNKALVPIKFAVPPFGTNVTGYGTLFSDFETSTLGDHAAPGVVDGWSVESNKVTVLTSPPAASSGTNYLALRNGGIIRTLATTPGAPYALSFSEERAMPLDPVHWWPGNANTMDIIGVNPQDATWLPLGSNSYAPGEVNAAFNFDPAGSNYLEVVASPSLDIGSGGDFTIDLWISPGNVKTPHPLLEWNDASGFAPGLSLWISANGPAALSANLVENTPARTDHVLVSRNSLIQTFSFQHVALTYSRTNNGLAKLYYNGAVVASTNLGTNITLLTAPPFSLYFGKHWSATNELSRFVGQMDEIGLYNQALTTNQIQDIFNAGALGRCGTLNPPSVCPAPMANVVIGGVPVTTITCAPTATNWISQPLSFTATGTATTLEIDPTNNPSGVRLDSFTLTAPGENNYFFPEEPLGKVIGENALGNWQLEVLDNRAGATNPPPSLLSWELNFNFVTPTPTASPLVHGVTQSNFIAPGSIVYYSVFVPPWAQFATNILFNVSNGPLNLLFNQTFLPGTNTSDVPLMTGVANSNAVTLINGVGNPPLQPGQTYYLGVQNTGATVASFDIQVDFDIITLTNGIPYTNSSTPIINPVHYYQYFVTNSNAVAVAFEILNPDGNVELVARQGAPLPDLTAGHYNYISDNPGSNNQAIVVVTNSTPVSLTPGVWYLGVFNNDTNTVNYRIRALESDPPDPNIIVLTNGVGFTFNSEPGVALTNFFEFDIPSTNTNGAALFELYNLSGNADLTLQFGELPYYPYLPTNYFAGSFLPGRTPEQIVIRTNNLGSINGSWFLGVPNEDPTNVTYTIRATLSTNGILSPYYTNTTIVVTQTGPGATNGLTLTWQSVDGETYIVQEATNLAPPIFWTNISTNVSIGSTTIYQTPPPPAGVPYEFFRLQRVPAP